MTADALGEAAVMLMEHNGRLAVAVHDAVPPTDEEWSRWMAYYLERPEIRVVRALIESDRGAGPNAKQRKLIAELMQGVDVRAAILTSSVVVRGIVTAIAWFGIPQRAYPLGQYQQAAGFLALTSDELAWATLQISALREKLGN